MNSVLQQLFMLPAFVKGIMETVPEQQDRQDLNIDGDLLSQLQARQSDDW
jgi:hypothetical protein